MVDVKIRVTRDRQDRTTTSQRPLPGYISSAGVKFLPKTLRRLTHKNRRLYNNTISTCNKENVAKLQNDMRITRKFRGQPPPFHLVPHTSSQSHHIASISSLLLRSSAALMRCSTANIPSFWSDTIMIGRLTGLLPTKTPRQRPQRDQRVDETGTPSST